MSDYTGLAMMTTMVTVGSTEVALIHKHKAPSIRPVIGGFALGLFLFAAGAVNPQIASLFCYLIITGALLINGGALLNSLATAQKGK